MEAGTCPQWKCPFNSCWPAGLDACFASYSAVAAAAVLTHVPQQRAGAGSMGSPGALAGWGLLDYKTEKYVITRNWRVGALQRLLQLGVMAYVVG